MHNAIDHHPSNDAQPSPKQHPRSTTLASTPSVIVPRDVMGYPFVQLGSVVLDVSLPGSL